MYESSRKLPKRNSKEFPPILIIIEPEHEPNIKIRD